jgi:hypothetical protein
MKRLAALLLALAIAVAAGVATPAGQASVPTPASVIGWEPCADYTLATYEQIADYFRKLDAATERMQLVEMGKTAEGRTQLLAIVSSETNMKNLARYKEIARRLATAKDLTDEQARALVEEGKTVAWVDFGLHSTEVAHAQTAPLFAHVLVTSETAEMRRIRDQVITLVVANMNPDGTSLVSSWYMKHVKGPYEHSQPSELYQKYAGHDNNRDFYMFNLSESRNIANQLYREWFPQLIHNHHQTGPFPARIAVPPFSEPMNPNIHPLVMRGINLVGEAMTRRLDREGKRGAISRVQYDTWWNGGMRSAPYYHNMIGILTETQHNSATPAVYDPKTFPKTFANGESTLQPSTFYPSPFLGGEWHLRNSCDYMVTASMAMLDLAAGRREEWLSDIYRMGRDAIRAGANETYVLPADQTDFATAAKLVDVLRWGGVEVERATAEFAAGGRTYPAGSFIVRGAQAFRPHLTDLLNAQVYPDRRPYPGGPPDAPYDITGWTLPMQMGVRVDKVAARVEVASEALPRIDADPRAAAMSPPAPGSITGTREAPAVARASVAYVLDPRVNDSALVANRLLKAGESVARVPKPIATSAGDMPPGAFLVSAGASTHARVEEAAKALGVRIATIDASPGGEAKLRMPRIGLYHAWGGNMDEGWTRYVLEQFEFPYTRLHDADVRAGNLRAKFDAIVLPAASYESMRSGLAPGTMPQEFTGGMTPKGVVNLLEFADQGGVLVAMDGAAGLPINGFGIPIADVTAGVPEEKLYIPGSILRIEIDSAHPVAYGMPASAAAFFDESPAFRIVRPSTRPGQPLPEAEARNVRLVARYPEKDLLMSGWLLGEEIIRGRGAVADVPVGRGRVILLGFRTQHRGQAHGTYKLLFNSIYLAGMDGRVSSSEQ